MAYMECLGYIYVYVCSWKRSHRWAHRAVLGRPFRLGKGGRRGHSNDSGASSSGSSSHPSARQHHGAIHRQTHRGLPDTPCMPYMPTLTPKTTPTDRHIWQSHGVFGTSQSPSSDSEVSVSSAELGEMFVWLRIKCYGALSTYGSGTHMLFQTSTPVLNLVLADLLVFGTIAYH